MKNSPNARIIPLISKTKVAHIKICLWSVQIDLIINVQQIRPPTMAKYSLIDISKMRHNSRRFPDDIFKYIFIWTLSCFNSNFSTICPNIKLTIRHHYTLSEAIMAWWMSSFTLLGLNQLHCSSHLLGNQDYVHHIGSFVLRRKYSYRI